MAKNKSNIPDLSKEDPVNEIQDAPNVIEEKPETVSKPRYVTVEETVEQPKESEKMVSGKQEEEISGVGKKAEVVEESKTVTPKSDVKVTPSFSLLDADKKSSESEKTTETAKVDQENGDVPQITLEPISGTSSEDSKGDEKEVGEEKSSQSSKEVKKWLSDTPITEDSGIEESKGIGKKIVLIVVIIMLVSGALGGGFYYYKNNMENTTESETSDSGQIVVREADDPTPTSIPTEEVEEEIVDLADYTVSILNGSGIPGEAGNVADLLEDAGFDEPDTGNAESYDYASTQVSLKETVPESVFDTITKALSKSYDVSSVPAELDEDSTYDIIVIVGADEPEPAPTATPTPEDLEE